MRNFIGLKMRISLLFMMMMVVSFHIAFQFPTVRLGFDFSCHVMWVIIESASLSWWTRVEGGEVLLGVMKVWCMK